MIGRAITLFGGLFVLVIGLGVLIFNLGRDEPPPAPPQTQAQPPAAPVPAVVTPQTPTGDKPPVAKIEAKTFDLNGVTRTDNYYWMRDKANPEVIAYLNGENAYTEAQLAPLKPLIDELYKEMADRIDDAKKSVPYFDNGYWYEQRYVEGASYPVIVRRKEPRDAPEEIVLDVPALAKDHKQFNLNNWKVSPDGSLVAYAVDFAGDRMHTIFVRRVATGEQLDASLTGADLSIAWASDNATLFYVKNDPVTVRGYQAKRHTVGRPASEDVLVYEEKDDVFSVEVGRTKSRKFIILSVEHLQTTEQQVIPAAAPTTPPKLIAPREKGIKYFVDHVGQSFYIRTNKGASDYRIVTAPEADPVPAKWTDVVTERPGTYLSGFQVFDSFIAVDEVHDAVGSVRVIRTDRKEEKPVNLPTIIGVGSMGGFSDAVNLDPSLKTVRLGFTSPTTPERIYDYDVDKGTLTLLREDPAVRWFKPEPYEVMRVAASTPDGESVPVTVVFRKDKRLPEGNPTLLLGYGSYGLSALPQFSPTWISLVDRGFILAIAHVRGGREKGERWYTEGRMLNKKNTFTDFIAAGEALVAQGYANKKQLFARGGSAGGLLMGAVANMRPELFAGIVAEVPFVDVVTTMSDPSIPLTTFEYEEWGNPAIKDQFDYMLSYSPYDRVASQTYPPLFVTAGLYDSQVAFFEPSKWVAKLRAHKTDQNQLIFLTEMDAGHAGDSGRLGYIDERAKIAAWLLDRAKQAGS
jgi:oligopeptidase B